MNAQQNIAPEVALNRGDFVRVREDHEDFTRAGKDGMVMEVSPTGVALYFGRDRYNRDQRTYCAGPEAWEFVDLDYAAH